MCWIYSAETPIWSEQAPAIFSHFGSTISIVVAWPRYILQSIGFCWNIWRYRISIGFPFIFLTRVYSHTVPLFIFGCSVSIVWNSSWGNVLVGQVLGFVGFDETTPVGSRRKAHPFYCDWRCRIYYILRIAWELWSSKLISLHALLYFDFSILYVSM